jgi:hypothetical protein
MRRKTKKGDEMMSWTNAIRTLMGVPYEYPGIAPVKPTEPVRRALDPVDPNLAMEEQHITALQRREYTSFSPVLSPTDPAVQAATFRNRFTPSASSEAERRRLAERAQQADFPVWPRVAPLIRSSPELERAEKRGIRAEYQSIVPVQRKLA